MVAFLNYNAFQYESHLTLPFPTIWIHLSDTQSIIDGAKRGPLPVTAARRAEVAHQKGFCNRD